MPKVELFWSCRRAARDLNLLWVLASRKEIFAFVRGKFTPAGETYFVVEYCIAYRMPSTERGETLAAVMARAEAHYADLGYVEPNRWNERVGGVEGLRDTTGETDLAEYREG
jgi:hypothetical protein